MIVLDTSHEDLVQPHIDRAWDRLTADLADAEQRAALDAWPDGPVAGDVIAEAMVVSVPERYAPFREAA